MKLIVAYIRPEVFTQVKRALLKIDVTKMSITNAMGCGAQRGYHESYRGADIEIDLIKKVRLEIAVNNEFVDKAIETIVAHAKTEGPDHSGDYGDGKIFVFPLEDCVRIRTGERGSAAIG